MFSRCRQATGGGPVRVLRRTGVAVSAIRLQLEAVGLGRFWLEGDLDAVADEIARRRSFALEDSAGARALLLADALTQSWRGDFATAVGLFETVAEQSERQGETRTAILAHAVLGWVWSIRGEWDRAEAESATAIALAQTTAALEIDAVIRAMRIGSLELPDWDLLADDLESYRRIGKETGRDDVVTNVDLAEGWALAASGRSTEALAMLRAAVTRLDAPLDRSVSELRIAEVLAADGRLDEAREVASRAIAVFESWGARYWFARSAMLLASIEGDRGGRHVRVVLDTMPKDPAFLRLIEPAGELVVDLAGRPAVRRDGGPVVFLTRHAEAAVRLLAAAGDDGMAVDELVSILWPEADQAKVGQRFRTMLWQVRSGLGPDAWRLQRRHETVTLRMTGVGTIGHLDRAAIAATFRD